jgi:hypothetical protein
MHAKPHNGPTQHERSDDVDGIVHANGARARLVRRRQHRARAACDGYAVTSSLSHEEPVSDAEIRLILGALGDTIARILGSDGTP